MDIVVVRGGALGDCVVTLPAIHSLIQAVPEAARLCVIGSAHLQRLAVPDVFIDQGSAQCAWLFADDVDRRDAHGPSELLAAADLVLAYTPGGYDSALSRNLQSVCSGRLVPWDPRPSRADHHIVDHLLQPLRQADIPTATLTPQIEVLDDERERGAALLPQPRPGQPLILLHPGSGGAHKRWPLESFHELAQHLASDGLCCAMVCGPVEIETTHHLKHSQAVPLIRHSSVPDLIALTAAADLFVGNDSGPAHVAAAVGTPTITLFGPTNPAIWQPLAAHSRALHARGGQLDNLGVDFVRSTVLSVLSGEADDR